MAGGLTHLAWFWQNYCAVRQTFSLMVTPEDSAWCSVHATVASSVLRGLRPGRRTRPHPAGPGRLAPPAPCPWGDVVRAGRHHPKGISLCLHRACAPVQGSHGQIDFTRFFDWLGRQAGSYVLSLNGRGEGLREVVSPSRCMTNAYRSRGTWTSGSTSGGRPDQVRNCDVDRGSKSPRFWKPGNRKGGR